MTSPTDDRLCRSFDYRADVESIALARRDVAAFVTEHFTPSEAGRDHRLARLLERLLVVVSELGSNAVEAAPGQWFQVEVTIDGSDDGVGSIPGSATSVICSVTNTDTGGEGDVVPGGTVDDPLAARGRGLVIVGALADRYRVERLSGTIVVTAELHLETEP